MSPGDRLVIVLLGTIALHVSLAVALALIEPPERDESRAPRLEMVDLDLPPPAPPPVVAEDPEPEPEDAPEQPRAPVAAAPTRVRTAPVRTTQPAAAATTAPEDAVPDPGGGPVLHLPEVGQGQVAVVRGPKNRGGRGGGGKGGGKGTGDGQGEGSAPPPAPMSVASIKTRAKPKGDYGYFDARKDYPAEARRLEVEGQIKVRLDVDDRGKVTQAKLINKLGHGLDELALARARVIEFEPARDTDDRPVASIVVWTFRFTLPD
jgi:periplasmic protein TonB